MKKIVVLSLICFLSVQFVSAQRSGSLSGIITDEATGEIIPGAVVELTQKTDTTKKKYESSDTSGRFNMSNVNYGSYRMTVIYLGYENYVRELEINQRTTNLGNVLIKQASRQIDAVKVEAQAIRTSQAGDTLMYNADAFKVTKDSDVEGLLAKMPGLTVIDGKVEAQGEEVKKVFVDGKELFGDNVSTVIRNLPAEVVSQVEVFNKLSDQAEMTGVDDGEGYKAINLVTTIKGPSQYGRAYAGYGFNDKYTAGLNLNYVNGNHRFTIIGGANNINQTDFSGDDILGTQSSNGISMCGG